MKSPEVCIRRLYQFADDLASGEQLHITRLMSMMRLVKNRAQTQRLFISLVEYALLHPRQAVHHFPVLPPAKKKFVNVLIDGIVAYE